MASIAKTVEELAIPVAKELSLSIWVVEYRKEGGRYILRIYIDKEGGVSIDDCVNFTRAINPVLDEADPIKDTYYLEVSSPGLDRALTRPEHFEKYLGVSVDVKLYKVHNGKKAHTGTLISYTQDTVTIKIDNEDITFNNTDISTVRLTVDI